MTAVARSRAAAGHALARVLLCVLPWPCCALAAPFVAIAGGERLAYTVALGPFGHAGDVTITGGDASPTHATGVIAVSVDMRTRGLARALFAFDSTAVAEIDVASGRLARVTETGNDGRRAIDSTFVVDYATRTAAFTDRVRPARSRTLPLPDGDPIDLISALLQTRDWTLEPGQHRDVLVQSGRDFYQVAMHATGHESVRTPLGTHRALVLEARMEGEPRGIFRRGGGARVWIAQDDSRLPVQMQVTLRFGRATLLLQSSTAPSPADGPAPRRTGAASSRPR
jgi:hypothetical protein